MVYGLMGSARMQKVVHQLEQVRRLARVLLLLQRLMQWTAALACTALVCGVVDYLLRLPWWLRLTIDVCIVALAVSWMWGRMKQVVAFRPDLSALALRAERLYPRLAGALASGVEFAADASAYADPERTGRMAETSVLEVQKHLGGRPLGGLFNPTRTLQIAAVLAVALLGSGLVVAAVPDESAIALRRWLGPLRDTPWPRRTRISSLMDREVWPDDTPLPLEARVERGYRSGMRVWAVTRLFDADGRGGPVQRLLMTFQPRRDEGERPGTPDNGGTEFARLFDWNGNPEGAGPDAARPQRWTAIELRFEAGDDQTPDQTIRLVPRPAVEQVSVHIEPPQYARALVGEQDLVMEQGGYAPAAPAGSATDSETDGPRAAAEFVSTAAGLVGSHVTMRFAVNGAKLARMEDWQKIFPGFATIGAATFRLEDRMVEARFRLDRTVQSGVQLVDEHGLSNMSERVYRVEARRDELPTVSLLQPEADESVLATAVIETEAVARDDVGVEWLALEALLPGRDPSPEVPPDLPPEILQEVPADLPAMPVEASGNHVAELARVSGRRARLELPHRLDLAGFALRTGDRVVLTGATLDVFDLDGLRHDTARSAPRTLRIIEPATLVREIRGELAGLRRPAIRLEAAQNRLMEATEASGQKRVSRRVETQQSLVRSLRSRLERNRLDNESAEPLRQLMDGSDALLDQAAKSSDRAAQQLEEAERSGEKQRLQQLAETARPQQQQVSTALQELVRLLDQGSDVLTIQLQLQGILKKQRDLGADTRNLLPRTLGQDPDQLDESDRGKLGDLGARQEAVKNEVQNLVGRMQSTSQVLSRQSAEPQDQAAAAALSEAAAIAQRQGLDRKMQRASELARQNRLSESAGQQDENAEVLEKMLESLTNQKRREQEILRRRLLELAQSIARLIEQQKAQIDRLPDAAPLTVLADPMSRLWRNTLAVQDQAQQIRETHPAAAPLGRAAAHQSLSVTALRAAKLEVARTAETGALTELEEALRLVREMQRKQDEDRNRQKRAELRDAYRRLGRQQAELRGKTRPYVGLERLSRLQRADLVRLGMDEADIRNEADDLSGRIEQTIVFVHLHARIDSAATRVADRLRTALAETADLDDEQMIADMLNAMAEALDRDEQDEPFAGQNQVGGGGGGGGGASPLIPPVAELKLVRGVQQSIHQRTRQLDQERIEARPEADQRRQVQRLAIEQRELVGIGQKLIEKLRAERRPAGPPQPQGPDLREP